MKIKDVVIVGGGFAGTKAALELAKVRDIKVTLISDRDYFLYRRTLYRVATGGRAAGARVNLAMMLKGSGVTFVQGEASQISRDQRQLITQDGRVFKYDILILALGTVTNYFGIPGLARYSYGIKSADEAEHFKKQLHRQLADFRRPDENYVIIGAGPSGVELAGSLPAYLRQILKEHGIANVSPRITLIEAASRVLPVAPKAVSAAVAKRLISKGITVMTDTKVKGLTPDTVITDNGTLSTRTAVWTAGLANNPFFSTNSFQVAVNGKVEVDQHLQAEPGIFVIGDNANTPHSGVAATALRDGKFVAENVGRLLKDLPMKTYSPQKPISVIPIGSRWASIHWGNKHVAGYHGWIIHHLVDLFDLHTLQTWPSAGKQWAQSMSDESMRCPECLTRPV